MPFSVLEGPSKCITSVVEDDTFAMTTPVKEFTLVAVVVELGIIQKDTHALRHAIVETSINGDL